MREMLRHRPALVLVAAGLAALAVAHVIAAVAVATLSGQTVALVRAASWVRLAAPVAVLVAALWVSWALAMQSRWIEALEGAGLVLGALFLSIGALLTATGAHNSRGTFTGLGFGLWALVAFSAGFVAALSQRQVEPSGPPLDHQVPVGDPAPAPPWARPSLSVAPLWFCGGFGVLLYGIGSAVGSQQVLNGFGDIIAGGILGAIGAGLVVMALAAARASAGVAVPGALVAGVVVIGLAILYTAIADYEAFQYANGAMTVRILLTVAAGVYAVAAVLVMIPAWAQVQRIHLTPARYGPQRAPARPVRRAIYAVPSPGRSLQEATLQGGPLQGGPPVAPSFPNMGFAGGPQVPNPGAAAPRVPSSSAPQPQAAAAQASVTRPAAFCSQCGAARVHGAKFCRSCGTPFGNVAPSA